VGKPKEMLRVIISAQTDMHSSGCISFNFRVAK